MAGPKKSREEWLGLAFLCLSKEFYQRGSTSPRIFIGRLLRIDSFDFMQCLHLYHMPHEEKKRIKRSR